jgi:protein-tyrosine phosphatase
MDNENYRNIIKLSASEQHRTKVKLILNELYPGENRAVPDPYYGTDNDFQAVYDLLDQATDVVITKIQHGTIR